MLSRPLSLDAAHLCAALSLRDLTDPAQGPHAMQRLLADVIGALGVGASRHSV